MILSVSQEQMYRKCRRAWFYRYSKKLRPKVEQPWLTSGKVYEELIYIFHRKGYEQALSYIHLKEVDQYRIADMEFILSKLLENDEKEKLKFTQLAGKAGYQFEFSIPYSIPEISDQEVTAHGFFDDVVEINNQPAIFEGKTTSDCINYTSEYWKKLDMDAQISCYAWAASKCLGYPVNRILYHVIRKPKFSKFHTVKGEEVPYTIKEYKERMAKDKNVYVSRRMVYVSNERQTLWAIEHLKSAIEINDDISASAAMEFNGFDGTAQFKRNFSECDSYGGCPYREACNLSKRIEELEHLEEK